MKILRSLSRKKLSLIVFFSFFSVHILAEDKPVDIWDLNKKILENQKENTDTTLGLSSDEQSSSKTNIYNMQSKKKGNEIKLDQELISDDIKIVGLYDPGDYDLSINMWLSSDGDQLKRIFKNLSKIDLSKDASNLMNISMLTNAYYPEKNISNEEFSALKSNWLIKNKNLELIEEYLIKNQIINLYPKLSRYLVDQYLSEAKVDDACRIFLKNTEPINNDYLSKFNIYCLIHNNRESEAQLILDLKKESGFKNKYFEKKINFLFGYDTKVDKTISEKTILDFHLAHKADPNFSFEPSDKTSKIIWKYLSSTNLLFKVQEIDITELNKISTIEKATHNKNYPEKDLYEIYKRFQFNINHLINAKNSYKSLGNIEARALIYQKILLESDINEKFELMQLLKSLFIKDKIDYAFDAMLKDLLENIESKDVPLNYVSFYNNFLENNKELQKKIKFNNDVLHQSKLINYFNGDYTKAKIEKDLNNFLKKIKKNKKYFISKKDIIFLESIKSDGIEISKKFDDLYEINDSEMPTDIQVMINNNEMGAALLRIIEVIGQDDIEKIDSDTMFFIISALNQLNIDKIRNEILLKVLPLKV